VASRYSRNYLAGEDQDSIVGTRRPNQIRYASEAPEVILAGVV